MQEFPDNWSLIDKINYLQRKILLNSYLYYEYNMNSLSDHFYDDMCKQLVEFQDTYNETGSVENDTTYGYVYYDFDGSTGFHLYGRLKHDDRLYLNMISTLFIQNRRGKM